MAPDYFGIRDDKVQTLKKLKEKQHQSKLCAFQGSCKSYCRFIEGHRRITDLLNAVHKKNDPFKLKPFNDKRAQACKTLIGAIVHSPIINLPKNGLPFSGGTDSSNPQVEVALFWT